MVVAVLSALHLYWGSIPWCIASDPITMGPIVIRSVFLSFKQYFCIMPWHSALGLLSAVDQLQLAVITAKRLD